MRTRPLSPVRTAKLPHDPNEPICKDIGGTGVRLAMRRSVQRERNGRRAVSWIARKFSKVQRLTQECEIMGESRC